MASSLILPPHAGSWRYPGGQPTPNKHHILYKDLRLLAVAMPGGQMYDYKANQRSFTDITHPNSVNTTMTPVGPAVQTTVATSYSCGFISRGTETMQQITCGVVLQALLTVGNQTLVDTQSSMSVGMISTGVWQWRIGGGDISRSPTLPPAINGHCYFYAVSCNFPQNAGTEMMIDLNTGQMVLAHNTSGVFATASGNYILCSSGSGVVNASKVAMGFISARYLDDNEFRDFGRNFWDLLFSRRREILNIGIYRGPTSGPAAPGNSVAPTIAGPALAPATLTVTNTGTWSGSPTFSYQWKRGTTNVGTNSPSYGTTNPADVGSTITCVLTGSNAGGSTTGLASNGILVTGLPQILSNPTLSGSSIVPGPLVCNPGTWTLSPTFSYQWKSNGANIAGAANSPSYPTVNGDIGNTITCVVTGTTSGGPVTAPATSPGIIPITGSGPPPGLLVQPHISGTAQAPSTLTCDGGSWSGSPTLAFQWFRNGSAPVGTNSNTYLTHDPDDVGFNIGCIVTATNVTGVQAAPLSNQILITRAPPPTTVTPGTPNVGIIQSGVLQLVQVQDNTGTWVTIGTIDPSTHTFTAAH